MESRRPITRRGLLQASAVSTAGVLAATAHATETLQTTAESSSRSEASKGGSGIMLDKITVAAFAACIGTAFRVHPTGGAAINIKLMEAKGHGGRYGWKPDSGQREPFSLLFIGPREPWLTQNTYRMEHDRLGVFEMFIVPLGPAKEGMQYEAVFN